jgi:RNA polymerase sigma-70 factor (ECF subfamily)
MGVRAVEAIESRPDSGEAFREVVVRFGPCLRALAFRRLGDRAAAEDVVQETFLRTFRARNLDLDEHLWPWLATVATNLCIDRIRRSRAREVPLHDRDLGAPGHVGDAYENCLARERRDAINDVLSRINGRHRRILLLRAEEGLSHADIARAEGTTIEAVKSALKRSRSTFRRMYMDVAFELDA